MPRSAKIRFVGSWSTLLATLGISVSLLGCRSFYGPGPASTATPPAPPPIVATGIPAVTAPGPPAVTMPGAAVVVAPSGRAGTGPPTLEPGRVAVRPPQATTPPLFPGLPPGPAVPHRPGGPAVTMAVGQLSLLPQTMVAPVGSDVVLLATARDGRGQPLAGQRVEWMLSPDSVGQLITLDRNTQGRKNKHRIPTKVDNHFAVGTTSSRLTTITRGTPTQVDDVVVGQGQAWISVSSATDGTSYVTAFAPNLPAWDSRKQTSIIYWVDAQFSFPAPIIGPVGSPQVLSTIVTRTSDGSPLKGYQVRYSILDGPPAGFSGSSTTEIEVPTDGEGRAVVELFQTQPARGENTVQVEVVRPHGFSTSGDRRLLVGRGTTLVTWTSPDINARISGPQEAQVGSTATYRIDLVNPGDGSLANVVVTNRVPSGLRYQQSSLAAENLAGSLQWRLDSLGPGQSESIEVDYEVTRPSTIRNCITVSAAEGLTAESCATTQTVLPDVQLRVSGPETVRVGQPVTFAISITNPGSLPVTGLVIKDTFGPGLVHAAAVSPIERELGTLGPGETRDDLAVTFRVARAGRLCHQVQLSGQGLRPIQQTVCVNALAAAPPAAADGAVPPLTPEAQADLQVEKKGPATAQVGDKVLFDVIVTNSGDTEITNIKIRDDYDFALRPLRVSEGFKYEDEKLTWTIDRLLPRQSRTFQVEAQCQRPQRACSRATVSAAGGLLVADEACLQIEPAAGAPSEADQPNRRDTPPNGAASGAPPTEETPPVADLKLQMTDLRDEVAVGQTVTYEVTIRNPGEVVDRNVELVLSVPVGMSPVATGMVAPSKATIAGRRVRFNPVAEIRPGETLIYRIPVRADRAGRFVVEAKAVSAGQRKALLVNEETNIYSEQN